MATEAANSHKTGMCVKRNNNKQVADTGHHLSSVIESRYQVQRYDKRRLAQSKISDTLGLRRETDSHMPVR